MTDTDGEDGAGEGEGSQPKALVVTDSSSKKAASKPKGKAVVDNGNKRCVRFMPVKKKTTQPAASGPSSGVSSDNNILQSLG